MVGEDSGGWGGGGGHSGRKARKGIDHNTALRPELSGKVLSEHYFHSSQHDHCSVLPVPFHILSYISI